MTARRLLTSVATIALACAAAPAMARTLPAEGAWTPTSVQIEELEAHLPKAPPSGIKGATRYYYGMTENGHQFIVGEILSFGGSGGQAGVQLQRELPIVMDGGCGVINLTYDVAKRSFVGYACNGMA